MINDATTAKIRERKYNVDSIFMFLAAYTRIEFCAPTITNAPAIEAMPIK